MQELVAIGIEQHCDSIGKPRACAVCRIKVHGECLVCVLPQFVLKALFFCPTLEARDLIKAHADNLNTKLAELVVEVAVPATLDRSTIAPGQRVEPDDCGAIRECGGVTCAAVSVGR